MKTDYASIKRNVRIEDYARSIGFTPVRIGRWYTLKEHDSVRIDPEKNLFYRNSTGESGSVIDFALAFTGKDLSGVIKDLENCAGIRSVSLLKDPEPCYDAGEKKLILPKKAKTFKNIYAYLIHTRKIPKYIVDQLVARNMLYQDERNNCVFVSYLEGEPVYACLRGTNTYKKFRGDVSGSDCGYGFMLSNGSDKLCVTESVIDALSMMAMRNDEEAELLDYLSLSGATKYDAAYNHLSTRKYERLYIALDNDIAGIKAAERIKREVIERGLLKEKDVHILIPEKKDWNEDLVHRKQ